MMNWTEFIVVTMLNLAGYLSALMLGISLGEKHIIRQVNRTLDQMRKEQAIDEWDFDHAPQCDNPDGHYDD